MSLHCWADLATGMERQMTTGGREKAWILFKFDHIWVLILS